VRDRQQRAAARHGPEADAIARELRAIQARGGHNLARIWDDWISAMALAISNSVDRRPEVRQRREAEYMEIVERHGSEVMEAFRRMLGMVVAGLEGEPIDLLGGIYMGLELGSNHAGQFFTPSGLCEAMARLLMDPDHIRETIEREGWITIHEPAIGGGATVIPTVRILIEHGYNPSRHLHVVGIDVDWTVLRMAYVQLSLLGVPAVLYVGDTLRAELRDDWYSPVHVLLGWGPRLRARQGDEDAQAMAALIEATETARDLVDQVTGPPSEPQPEPELEPELEPQPPSPSPVQGQLFEGL